MVLYIMEGERKNENMISSGSRRHERDGEQEKEGGGRDGFRE